MKRKVGIVIAVILIIGFLLGYIISYANTGTTIYAKLTKVNEDTGVGYGIGDPSQIGGSYIWNIASYDSSKNKEVPQRNLYCIKANYGETWNLEESWVQDTGVSSEVKYNLSFDLQAQRAEILNKLEDDGNDGDDVLRALLDPSDNGYYRELLWILDNSYIDGVTNKTEFLSKAGITQDPDGITGYEFLLTAEDIKAVQKAAIWYYTNYKTDYDATDVDNTFNLLDADVWLTITDDGNSYEYLSDLTKWESMEGEDRNEQANILYKYLVEEAAKPANKGKYTSANNYTLTGGTSVKTTGLATDKDGKYIIPIKRVGTNYVVGPIVINTDNTIDYDINLVVANEKNKEVDYIFTDKDGNSLGENLEVKDFVGNANGFYVSISRSLVESVNIQVEIEQAKALKTLWLSGTETSSQIKLKAEQPLVELTKSVVTVNFVSAPTEFDLSLRKYITEVNGFSVTNKRLPNISESTLQTGTTAIYRHRKDPVVVKENDIVTYSITIYNEGNQDGYASQIIDQLPTELRLLSKYTSEPITSKGKDENRNTYNVTYEASTNRITFDIVNTADNPAMDLAAYDKNNGLDYETITFECKVTQKADSAVQKVLTNIAWISNAHNSEIGENETTVDRDSQPTSSPNATQGNMSEYIGKTTNKTDLTDSTYYYEGQQDDDDFEKLVVMPIIKEFDLALFKHIAAISKDATIEDGEYITDTGDRDGVYLRAPVVQSINPDTGKITYKEDDKEALTVEPGDYVLYTIRVYNEGEIDGYVEEIKDTLPVGLEFVSTDSVYNHKWTFEDWDEDGRQIITTTYYGKGKGLEAGTSEDDENYNANLLKALNPEGEISKENPDYIDAQILCKVVEQATSNRILVNYAQISEDSDDDVDSTPDEWIDGDDDQDIERIKLQCFDLSLRKFITGVNDVELKENGKYTRAPQVDISPINNGLASTANYIHTKEPVGVQIGDIVTYTIRVYNEGDIDGYASKVTDYLPPYLTYLADNEINKQYGWQISDNGRIATTTYLANKELTALTGTTIDYEDIKIVCVISDTAPVKQKVTNIAEISEYKYNGNVVPKDIDSTANNMESANFLPEDKDLPTYKDSEMNKEYIPGNEDDDDFEKVYVRDFDLALRKFITQVQNKEVTTRIPKPKYENGKISYEHPKDAITVHVDDVVIYTLRIYNEGEISGYASEITDDIPEYLEYLPENSTNVKYMWKMYDENGTETTEVQKAVKIKTEYLSKEKDEDNLIKAFDGKTLHYKDIKIAFKVKDPNSNTYIITNHAQISDDADENGKPIKDKDSEPDKWNEGEDDQDIENVKVEYFDLALLKFVSKVIVIEDGKEQITTTGYNGLENPEPVVKVELHRKKLSDVIVKFGYGITITNQGDIPGYATEITDYIPAGLRFEAADNPLWTDEGNNVISTKQLEGKLLQPGESTTVEVILTWNNGADNLNLKTNTAEISADKNEYDVPDRDSTPDNKKEGEDDIDIAKVILSIATGATKTYFTLTLGLLGVIALGIFAIKKFVL